MDYKSKYLKYKNKYNILKIQSGGNKEYIKEQLIYYNNIKHNIDDYVIQEIGETDESYESRKKSYTEEYDSKIASLKKDLIDKVKLETSRPSNKTIIQNILQQIIRKGYKGMISFTTYPKSDLAELKRLHDIFNKILIDKKLKTILEDILELENIYYTKVIIQQQKELEKNMKEKDISEKIMDPFDKKGRIYDLRLKFNNDKDIMRLYQYINELEIEISDLYKSLFNYLDLIIEQREKLFDKITELFFHNFDDNPVAAEVKEAKEVKQIILTLYIKLKLIKSDILGSLEIKYNNGDIGYIEYEIDSLQKEYNDLIKKIMDLRITKITQPVINELWEDYSVKIFKDLTPAEISNVQPNFQPIQVEIIKNRKKLDKLILIYYEKLEKVYETELP